MNLYSVSIHTVIKTENNKFVTNTFKFLVTYKNYTLQFRIQEMLST